MSPSSISWSRTEVGILLLSICFALVLALFVAAFYSLLSPKVLPNPGLSAYKPPARASVIASSLDRTFEVEHASTAMAEKLNAEIQTEGQVKVVAPQPARQKSDLVAKQKEKRIVRTRVVRRPFPRAWNAWAYVPHHFRSERRRSFEFGWR